jgi:hypothetical protein
LTDVVVKLSANSGTFLLLCLNQLAADVCERGFREFPLGDVDKRDHRPNNLLPSTLGIRPILNRETCSIRPPKHLVLNVYSFPSSRYKVDSALLYGERCPVRTSVMDQIVHVLAKHLVNVLVSQSAEAGRVAERASVFEINSVNGFCGGVKKKSKLILTFVHLLLEMFPLKRLGKSVGEDLQPPLQQFWPIVFLNTVER